MPAFGLKHIDDPRRDEYPKFMPQFSLEQLPPTFDWKSSFPTPDDQGPFGTCVSFGDKNNKYFQFYSIAIIANI